MFHLRTPPLPLLVPVVLLVLAPSSPSQGRMHRVSGPPSPVAPAGPGSGLVVHDLATGGETPASLVQALVGPGPVVTNVRFTGARIAAGTFSGGTGIVGFESGVVLGTGNITTVLGPWNTNPAAGTDPGNGLPGDPDLDTLIPPSICCTQDATVLEFDLECTAGTAISFQYVFSSDEYDEIPGQIDDVFACFVNGQSITHVPGTNDPISLQTVNRNRNREFYRSNDCSTLGLGFPCSHLATEMDGMTVALSATAALQPGANHVKLAIADGSDDVVDSNLFLRAQSLVCSPGVPVFETPSTCALVLDGWSGAPFVLDVRAWATNDLPGASLSLDATGDAIPLAGGSFQPPIPTSPAQPGTTRFTWTPTSADLGLYHLTFTATDQILQSESMEVAVRISVPGMPQFDPPSPCGQVLEVQAGLPLTFQVRASAWTSPGCGGGSGTPGESVTLDVTGDPAPLAGGTFVPPLPAGPAQPVSTVFHWTPSIADVGEHQLEFTATDRLQQSASCGVTIRVRESPALDRCLPGTEGVIACPCGNPATTSPAGCDNSAGTGGARLDSRGNADPDLDTVTFTTTGEPPNALSVLFQGKAFLFGGSVYGQGVRCVGTSLKRLYVKSASGGSITAPETGDRGVADRSCYDLHDCLGNGSRRYYAVYYRDPTVLGGCPQASTFNITQTQEIVWHY